MKRKFKWILIFSLFLTACNHKDWSSTKNTSSLSFLQQLTFIDTLNQQDLPQPNKTISSLEELVYALDYLAFYEIDEKISFYISSEYAKQFYNISQEFSKAEDYVLIADAYPAFLDRSLYTDYQIITIDLAIQDIATKSFSKDNQIAIQELDYQPNVNQRNATFEDFPIYYKNNGKIHVETSQQLYYAVERGYLPICKKNSIAETIYEEAKNILRRIISDEMDDYTKAKQIFNFLTCEVFYDHQTAALSSYDLNQYQAYYLEGVFCNRYAVCDGKAKSYTLLAKMEGIDIVRVTDVNDSFQGHAYNYICIDNHWYLSCTTFGSHRLQLTDETTFYAVPSYNMFLTTLKTPYLENWGYSSVMYPDIKEKIEKEEWDYYATLINHDSLYIQDVAQLLRIIQYFETNSLVNKELEFQYDGDIHLLVDEISQVYTDYQIIALENRPFGSHRFSIIFLDKDI
mgnify:CR=1 FL=1